MKKKILFTVFNLEMGGISKALVNLLESINYDKYDVTVLLQVNEGQFLSKINPNVKVESYNLSKCKNKIVKKILNLGKFIKILIKHYHKYDFAGCYSSGYFHSALVALLASKNNAAWMHTNIINYMANSNQMDKKNKGLSTSKKVEKFINKMRFRNFKHNIFVSYDGMNNYLNLYPKDKKKCLVCHNLIDYNDFLIKANEKIDEKYDSNCIFLNVSRHSEFDKKLTRLINACDKLRNYDFLVLMIGNGPDHDNYVKMVQEKKLTDKIKFLGFKTNPFPYYKLANAFVLTSAFEGFPVVFLESKMMNIPIITTDVSDARRDVEGQYGIVVSNDDESIYFGMKEFLDNGFKITRQFNTNDFNRESISKLERLINHEKN